MWFLYAFTTVGFLGYFIRKIYRYFYPLYMKTFEDTYENDEYNLLCYRIRFEDGSTMNKLELTDEDITEIKPEESPSTEVPTTPTISTKVNFKLLDWNKFKLDKKEYSVEFTPYNTESNSPNTLLNVSGNSLPIYIYIKHPKGKIIEKALKNKEKNDESNLICAILVSEAVKKLMEIQNYSGKEIINIKNIIMNS